ncbi:MAG: hypothetical protein RQ760_22580, partial [Sedimentisphaerales bacterium]|nr:hypothetical protein [Sedimentisphaerales bacterium]
HENESLRKITYEIISLFMQNKPYFGNDKMSASLYKTRNYEEIRPFWPPKKQNQFNPKQSQFGYKGKNERFCVDKELYNVNNNTTRGSYHP